MEIATIAEGLVTAGVMLECGLLLFSQPYGIGLVEDAMTYSMPVLRWLCVLLLLVAPFARARVSDHDLQNEYGNKVLTLRQPHPGGHLHFDATGKLATASGASGGWTTDSQLRVHDISWHDGLIRIRGQRLFLFFDPKTKQMRDLATVTKKDPARKLFRKKKADEWAAKQGKVDIELEPGVSEPDMPEVLKAMNATFLAADEPLRNAVPECWKGWVGSTLDSQKANEEAAAGSAKKSPAFKVGGGVSAPRVKYSPDPEYSEAARQSGYQGIAVLWLVVGTDGLPHDIRIARAVGLGLDDKAVDAVQTWKFDPAMKEGQPVAVQINVEVTFKLY